MVSLKAECGGRSTAPKYCSVSDYRGVCPGFFDRGNRKFFGDRGYSTFRGCLIVNTKGGPAVYTLRKVGDPAEVDISCISFGNNVVNNMEQAKELAKKHPTPRTYLRMDLCPAP